MARPKSVFSEELAARARADMERLDQHKILQKLQAIVAASLMWPLVKFSWSYLSVVIKFSALVLSYGVHGVKPAAENGPKWRSSEAAGPFASTKHVLLLNSPGYITFLYAP